MKRLFLISLLTLTAPLVWSQMNAKDATRALNDLATIIVGPESDEKKLEACKQYKESLTKYLKEKNTLDCGLDSLEKISVLKSKYLMIYNWVLPHTDGSFTYFGVLHIQQGKDNTQVVELTDKSATTTKEEYRTLGPNNWYGALYYKLITHKKLGKNTFTLLGWDGNNKLTNKKIIEVITISSKGLVKFGAPILKTKKRTKKRVIFEYSENAVMSLKYHAKSAQIIFDFLVPTSSKLEGIPEYYGPALNRFDAFVVEGKNWVYQEDIDIELNKSIKDFMWNDPKEKP